MTNRYWDFVKPIVKYVKTHIPKMLVFKDVSSF